MIATFEWMAQKCPENTQIHRRANSATYLELRTLSISVKKNEMPEWLEDHVRKGITRLSMRAIAKVEVEVMAMAEVVNSTTLEAEAEVVAEVEAVEAVAEVEVEEGGNIYSFEGLRVHMMSTRRGLSGRVFFLVLLCE
jgi:hypothetical protein